MAGLGTVTAETFYARLNICQAGCDYWDGACRKGHTLRVPVGCPVRKFPPIAGFGFMENKTAPAVSQHPTRCEGCGKDDELPTLTWLEIIAQFGDAMLRWAKAGLPVLSGPAHGVRYRTCAGDTKSGTPRCTYFKDFYCHRCRCVAYVKSKLATETCPEDKWPKPPAS
jgi:hypothetical protein